MFQVVVAVCGIASVLIVVVLSPCFRCVKTIIVATDVFAKKSTHFGTGSLQQFGECTKAFPSQVPQLLAMAFLHRLIEPSQQLEPLRRDSRHYHSPVLGFAAASDQTPLF